MDCLADTVMVIRHFSGAGKIGRRAYELISGVERGEHHCYVSTISLAEILYLSEIREQRRWAAQWVFFVFAILSELYQFLVDEIEVRM